MADRIVPDAVGSLSAERDLSLFKVAVEAAGEAVIITAAELDAPGPQIAYVNPAFTRMTGYTLNEVVGQSPRILQGARTDRAVLDRMPAELTTGKAFRGEVINYRKDGTAYVLEWHVTGARDEAGQVTHWVSVQRDISDRKALEERQTVLLAELQHRVRNNLALIRSIARRTAETSVTAEDYAMHLNGRMDVLARVQTLISQDPTNGIDLGSLISDELLAQTAREGQQAKLTGPPVLLRPRAAELLGLAMHELATNAMKYGALRTARGRVSVTWRVDEVDGEPSLVLEWAETGGSIASTAPRRSGFGTAMLEKTLAYELQAEATQHFVPGGLSWTIVLPVRDHISV
ncbi:HWE histidine kinase domain-containing protein [Methylobacterium oxalidis]|uniref:HWE histidine kinase domain-containing protein n=1 Tax=Methylobacterium oxalidis TaxID=944322 RepID=UPI0033147DA4